MDISAFERMPKLVLPFTLAQNPHAAQVQLSTTVWAQHFGIIRSQQSLQHFEQLQYGTFMAHMYPTASRERLALVADWHTWLATLDDQFDKHHLAHNPAALGRLHEQFLVVLRGERPHYQANHWFHSLHNLTKRFTAMHDAAWMQRFIARVEHAFAAAHAEARSRLAEYIPCTVMHYAMQRRSATLHMFFTLIEFAEQMTLPEEIVAHPRLRRLEQLAANQICWHADLVAFPTDSARSAPHNYVTFTQQQRGVSPDAAITSIAKLHNQDVRTFERLKRQLAFGEHQEQAQRYVAGLEAWMAGTAAWSISSSQYHPGALFARA